MSPWDWQVLAACDGMDINLFFGHEGEQYNQDAKRHREARARAVCASCPVAAECLAYALERPEKSGTWGGLSEDQLKAKRRQASRARLAAQQRQQVAS